MNRQVVVHALKLDPIEPGGDNRVYTLCDHGKPFGLDGLVGVGRVGCVECQQEFEENMGWVMDEGED